MSPSTPNESTRFLPGAMIANRYRVVALLGKGGMGEVYRADDTKLGEAVALKFLPERLENDESLRERFLGEARLARLVAHPNVCRVYDLGEVDGRLFLSMEYVDGEDLATLLRRIGRLPQEKAVQLAHQMCAGLQAAHEQGIVHRDLKPANVMIDGRGRARITDFGLAAIAASVTGREAAAGTPAYMAPEQLAGQEATVRSDVYALGLVLYELFTGRPAFEAHTWAEQLSVKQSRTPSSPSQLAPGLDPTIERVVLRCLLPEASQRPASAAAVAMALPGGDPLAAALAAGETPSPEMVAEAGGEVRFPRAVAWGWFGALVAGLVAMFAIAPHAYRIQQVPIEKPPAVLVDRAREVAKALGWNEAPRDEYSTLVFSNAQASFLQRRFGSSAVIAHLRRFPGGTFRLLYRRSPKVMTPLNALAWAPGYADPPLADPGMLTLTLDGSGRMLSLEACPVEHDSTTAPAADVAWGRLFALAGLDSSAFQLVTPEWVPSTFADRRLAWTGRVPGDTTLVLRVEAASYRGAPVMFRSVFPWTPVPVSDATGGGGFAGVLPWVVYVLFFGLLALAGFGARRSLRDGRADTRGALRMATAASLLLVAAAWTAMHYAPDPSLLAGRVFNSLSRGLLLFLVTSILYLTLEPIVRRTWPTMLVSWVRLLDGRWRDSLVGRDALAGLALGALFTVLVQAGAWAFAHLTGTPGLPEYTDSPGAQTDAMMGTAAVITMVLRSVLGALQTALSGAALAALFTQFTRKRVLSLVFAGLVMLVIQAPGFVGGYTALLLPLVILVALVVLARFGFVALLAFLTAYPVLSSLPLVLPGTSWYWPTTAVGMVILLGLALLCLRSMLAGPAGARHADDLRRSMFAAEASAYASAARATATPGSATSARPVSESQVATVVTPPRPPDSQTPTQWAQPDAGSERPRE